MKIKVIFLILVAGLFLSACGTNSEAKDRYLPPPTIIHE